MKSLFYSLKNFLQIIIKNSSHYSIIFTFFFAFFFGVFFHKWSDDKIIVSDVIDYYLYLPAGIIYNDLNFEFKKELPIDLVRKKVWHFKSPTGKPVLKMTMGVALCNLPFFILGHIYASISDKYENNGYSTPYYLMVFISAMFYLWLGLLYLRKLLLLFFKDEAAAIVIILIVMATNLLYYATIEPGMSHVYNFALISMFIYFSFKWLSKASWKRTITLGLLLGIITLIRPINSLVVLFPLLVFLFGQESFHDKWSFIKNNILKILLAFIFMMLVILPQMIYWKLFTGQWIYYSYGAEIFYFNNPHIFEGLLSFRKGWLVYTPIMFFSIIGLFFLIKSHKRLVLPIVIFSILNLYVIFSWWCWWYGGSYGSRPMIDTYAIYAIPLAAFVQFFLNKKVWKRVLIGSVFVFFIYFNTFQIRQYNGSLLHYADMTKEAYIEILFKLHTPENYYDLLQKPDYESALKGEDEKLDKK